MAVFDFQFQEVGLNHMFNTMCAVICIFNLFPETKGIIWFLVSVRDCQISWLCSCLTVWDWRFWLYPEKWVSTSLLEIIKITSSIESRLNRSMCVTAWCGCELYHVYKYIYIYIYLVTYVCVTYAHVIYTLWYSHTPLWTQEIILFSYQVHYYTRGLLLCNLFDYFLKVSSNVLILVFVFIVTCTFCL